MSTTRYLHGPHPDWPWGKAGERLTVDEARKRAGKRSRQRGRERFVEAKSVSQARSAWERGLVKPWRITAALDLGQLYGPEVDRACGVEEPAVDRWEAGELYPTWEQLEALSRLTNFPVAFFTSDAPPIDEGTAFICSRMRQPTGPVKDPVLQFSHEALVLAGVREAAPIGELYTGRLF
jgi:hypothetical protein